MAPRLKSAEYIVPNSIIRTIVDLIEQSRRSGISDLEVQQIPDGCIIHFTQDEIIRIQRLGKEVFGG